MQSSARGIYSYRCAIKQSQRSRELPGKGAAIGAAGGAVVGAVSSKKSKDVAKGAAIGAAAGAGAGALKDSDDRKKADQARETYDMEYQHCMRSRGF